MSYLIPCLDHDSRTIMLVIITAKPLCNPSFHFFVHVPFQILHDSGITIPSNRGNCLSASTMEKELIGTMLEITYRRDAERLQDWICEGRMGATSYRG